ncbi:MAG TPA: serine hydrolase domain-containing protein [Streptosporangiaceae bacterium]|nr:serine hydrolase domain-containing protein [Streptosporangiaceae bacterium]
MGHARLGRVGELLTAAVRAGQVPGAVAAAGRGPVTLECWAAGWADTTPGTARRMAAGTVFDLASLTKVVATTTAILALAGRGSLSLDDPVTRYLPAFAARWEGPSGASGPAEAFGPAVPVTVRHLLTHTAGLPDTRKFYQWCSSRQEVLGALYRTPLDARPGTKVVYSDLGFMALGEVVAAASGMPLDAAVRRLVTGPLGMRSTGFAPLAVPPARVAATERRGDGMPWTGTVHDENARALGGVAGHAGLFSTVADLARFARWWVSGDDRRNGHAGPVPAHLRTAAASCQTPGLGGCRGLGWVCRGDSFDFLGDGWPPTAVSHTGFTGTSLALDPVSGLWVVLLTNAVHFGRDHTAIKALRRDVHAAVAEALLG